MFLITENSQAALSDYLAQNGFDRYRAKQIWHWIYKKAEFKFSEFYNLPQDVINFLKAKCSGLAGEEAARSVSKSDSTEKFLIKLKDGNLIESVLLHAERGRLTACLSTQVGCSVCCLFCASGKSGFKRNLTTAEIISQYLIIRKSALCGKKDISNIVFMGIGEPLMNYDNLISAVGLLTDPDGANIGSRRITVSTSGVIPAIEKLAAYKKQIRLSISLHSALDEKRDLLVPLNKKYNIESLFKAIRAYIKATNRPVTFEYVLIKGLNDTKEDIAGLTRVLKGLRCNLNLIPYNPVEGLKFRTPSNSDVNIFARSLIKNKIKTITRHKKGFDINSGCGQLKASWPNN